MTGLENRADRRPRQGAPSDPTRPNAYRLKSAFLALRVTRIGERGRDDV